MIKNKLTKTKWLLGSIFFILVITISLPVLSSYFLQKELPNNASFHSLDVQDGIQWSPDSTKIVGSVLGEGAYPKSQIFVWDSISGEYSIVSNEKAAEIATGLYISSNPQWHPSRESILYSSSHDFRDHSFGVVDLNKRSYSGLGNGLSPSWFMDGTQIIYIADSKKSLQVLDLTSKEDEVFFSFSGNSQIENIAISPNGDWLSMISRVLTATGLWKTKLTVINVTSRESTSMLEGQFSSLINTWSSDSSWIIIEIENSLLAINLQNGCQTDLLDTEKIYSFTLLPGVSWANEESTIALSGNLGGQRGILFVNTATQPIQNWLSSGTCISK